VTGEVDDISITIATSAQSALDEESETNLSDSAAAPARQGGGGEKWPVAHGL